MHQLMEAIKTDRFKDLKKHLKTGTPLSSYQIRSLLLEAKDRPASVRTLLDHSDDVLTPEDATYVLSGALIEGNRKIIDLFFNRPLLLNRDCVHLLASLHNKKLTSRQTCWLRTLNGVLAKQT